MMILMIGSAVVILVLPMVLGWTLGCAVALTEVATEWPSRAPQGVALANPGARPSAPGMPRRTGARRAYLRRRAMSRTATH